MTSVWKNELTEYIPGHIWLKNYPIRFAGCRFNARMCVIRLSDGRLLIHSPCPIDGITKAEVEALGSVAVIVGPGSYHHFNIRSAHEAFPEAEIRLCPGIETKDPTLPDAKIISDEADPLWAGDLDHVLVRGAMLIREVAFFHRESATLILVDVIENFGDKTPDVGGLLKFWWWLFRMWNQPKPAPEYQLSWIDKAAARSSFERILSWEFDRIVIAHGAMIEGNAKEVARNAWRRVLETVAANQPVGYYEARQSKLLRELDSTVVLMSGTLEEQFGEATALKIREQILREYEALIPKIPYLGAQARMFNFFLYVTAQEVAAYNALKQFDLSPAEIWRLCHKALRLRTARIPRWKTWLLKKLMFSKFVHAVQERRAKLGQRGVFGDFEIEYLSSEGEDFDVGINYHRCANYRFAVEHGAEELAPFICMSDIALSDAFGWGLKRTQTLADGCAYCDFRMKEGAPTQLTSATPEVQQTIERIRIEEAGH